MRLKLLFASLAFLLSFTGAALAQDAASASNVAPEYYKNGLRMGSSFCAGHSFDCDTIASNQSEIIEAANECANTRFGIQDKILTQFSTSGEFENCVVPGGNTSVPVWAICCIKKSDTGTCDLVCTRYLEQKANPPGK